MNLIVPCAGKSSRFPSTKPKFLLTHPSGNLMVLEAIRGLVLAEPMPIKILIAYNREHQAKYDCATALKKQFKDYQHQHEIVTVEVGDTHSQPETVLKVIEDQKITGPIAIKDCDNYFRLTLQAGNFVSTANLNTLEKVNPSNKSYVQTNDDKTISNIVEKQVISNYFCSGCYGFAEAGEYVKTYQDLAYLQERLYLSHLVYSSILSGNAFEARECTDYVDWGTLEDWRDFTNRYGTLFVDLDGVLVENSAEYFAPFWGTTAGISGNIKTVNKLFNSGKVFVVITTSRKDRESTIEQLRNLGINYHNLVSGLPHGKRVVINDYAASNRYPSCSAINLLRDSEELANLLPQYFE